MSSSNTFIFRDNSGNGVDGKSIILRSVEDSNISYTLVPVSGKPGAYVTNSDMYFSFYKAYVDGEEDKSFGGNNGRPLGNPVTRFSSLEAFNNFVSDYNTTISSLNTVVAGKAGLAANNNFTGVNTFQQYTSIFAPITVDYADPHLDSAPFNLITNERLDYKIANLEGYAESPNFIRAAPGVRAQPGKVYPTINAAVNAFVNPSESNKCKVFIQGAGTSSAYIVASSSTPCIKSHVNLIAADRGVMISFPNVNCTEKVTIENATVVLGGGTTRGGSTSSRIWTNIKFINCRIYHFRNFTLKGGLLENCIVISPNGITLSADKDLNNVFTDIIGSTFRVAPSITDESTYAGAMDYKIIPSLAVIEDFTQDSDS